MMRAVCRLASDAFLLLFGVAGYLLAVWCLFEF